MNSLREYIIEKFKISKDIKIFKYLLILRWGQPMKYEVFDSLEETVKYIKDNNASWMSCFSFESTDNDDENIDKFSKILARIPGDEDDNLWLKNHFTGKVNELNDELKKKK